MTIQDLLPPRLIVVPCSNNATDLARLINSLLLTKQINNSPTPSILEMSGKLSGLFGISSMETMEALDVFSLVELSQASVQDICTMTSLSIEAANFLGDFFGEDKYLTAL